MTDKKKPAPKPSKPAPQSGNNGPAPKRPN